LPPRKDTTISDWSFAAALDGATLPMEMDTGAAAPDFLGNFAAVVAVGVARRLD
jgi:hypothetical protein